jgi:hypothetical protein
LRDAPRGRVFAAPPRDSIDQDTIRMTPWTAIAVLPFVVVLKLVPLGLSVADRLLRRRA